MKIYRNYIKTVLPKIPSTEVTAVVNWLPMGLYPDTFEFLSDFLETVGLPDKGTRTRYATMHGVTRQSVSQRLRRLEGRIREKWEEFC